ncbi:MAG: cell division protein FtsW, partial [Bacilli bacterium]|nr:cell division protein FtsW [Bacilli bacterium]
IQPSEAAKLGLIIFTSKYLSNSSNQIKSYIKGVFPILFITLFFFGLIMLQPDLGTGMILVISIISLLFIAGIDLKFFLVSGVFGLIGVVILILIAPYRLNRITSFIDPWSDALGTGFQIIQSLYAIGPEGLLGTGYLNSIQKHFYLPEPQTDFIFSIIAEEFGIVGTIAIVTLFSMILISGINIALSHKDHFAKYLSFGMTFQIIFQALMNLSVVIGLIPVTGVTLPFLSYGGSSLLVSMVSVGVILNISKTTSKKT